MSSFRTLALTAAAALTAGALTAGCDTVQPKATVTQQQAVERVAARAQEALQQLPSGAKLKVYSDQPTMPCDDGPKGSTFVETDYTIDYPDSWPVEQTVPTLADYWTKNGYKTVKDERTRKGLPAFSAEHPDGFRIGIQLTYRDTGRIDAFLISSSPCL
jgi:hypothetical protein